jgi:O-antigen ligase
LLAPNPIEEASVETRVSLAFIGIEELRAHPWLGTGAGNFALVSLRDDLQGSPPQPVHNVPALIVVETGLPGALAELLLAALALRAIRSCRGGPAPVLALGVALVPLAGFDHYLWTMGPPRVLVCLLAIFASDVGRKQPPNPGMRKSSVSPHAHVATAVGYRQATKVQAK